MLVPLLSLAAASGVAAAPPALRFVDATLESGIDLRLTSGGTPSRHILEVNGGGVALFDFDGDSDLDLFLANGATLAAPAGGPGSRLYANRGDGKLEDVTARAGIVLKRWAMGVAVGDYDGDGRDDLYVTCFGPNVLLKNETTADGPKFSDVTAAAGVGDPGWGTSAAFGDTDGDSDLDLYVTNYLVFDPAHPPGRAMFQGVPVMAGPAGLESEADVFYRNTGGGKFRDVTREAGIVERTPGYGLGVRMLDYDRDGKLDVFVGNDSTENFLFHNLGQGRFADVGVETGVATNHDGATQATMGIALGDVDSNGHPDLFTTNFSHDTNTLHLNLGDGFFDDRTSQFGLGLVSRPFLGWGCGFYDFDMDGDEDLFVSNGHVYPEAGPAMGSAYEQEPLLFERKGARFERAEGIGEPFDRAISGRAAAFGDVDGDGDVDVVVTTLNGPVKVFRNEAPSQRAIVVELEQNGGNHRAYGAMVELSIGGVVQRRWITGGGSYQSADAPAAYFGLGATSGEAPRSLRVVWPDGEATSIEAPPVDRRILVRRGAEPRVSPFRGR
jgi:hypothetical protein